MTPRLATAAWVNATMRRASGLGAFGAVLHRGDPESGAVIVCWRARDGTTRVLARVTRGADAAWEVALETSPDDFARVDEYLARQRRYDPDLWAIELMGGEIEQLVDGTILAR